MSTPATGVDVAADQYDIVVLGGGSGGYACALRAAELGLQVALVERDKLGGTCLHRGCIPTKALLHAAEVADTTREASRFGVRATFEGVDIAAVNTYRDGVVNRMFKGLKGLVESRGITVVAGDGRMIDRTTIAVGDRRLTGRSLVLGTGSYARSLPGLDIGGRIVTSEEALQLDWIPTSVIVLGGGVIGVEFASVWRSFGADVTIVEALPRLVAAEDTSVSTAFERAYRKRGIKALTGSRFAGAVQDDTGVTVSIEDGTQLRADLLLVAVGRGANTSGLGYEEAGITIERGLVVTDDRLATSVPGVYAVGDIVPGLQLAHRGFQHGMFVAEEIAGLRPVTVPDSGVPRVTYSEPEVASVGLTEAQARETYGEDRVAVTEFTLAANGKSRILDTTGFVKLVREKDGPVVGIHAIGSRMGEQVGEAQLIVNWEAFPEDVAALVHAHPTQNEAMGEAHLALAGKPLHIHD